MHLTDLFELALTGRAHALGLDLDLPGGGVRSLTFGELRARSLEMARALAARGIGKGDRVAVYLPNGLDFLVLFLATLRLGAIFTPINILYRAREIAHIVADADPGLVVMRSDAADLFAAVARAVQIDDLQREADRATGSPDAVAIDGDDAALIIYTSGTTGRAKGAVLSHNNVLANTAAIVTAWQITDRDRYLAVLPLFHVHGLANGVCSWLATGCRMRLVERFERDRVGGIFAGFEPTLFFGVPTVYVRLLDMPPDEAQRIGRMVRLFVSGSAPLSPQVFESFERRFGHRILERYGMSETLMLISNPYVGDRRPGAVGVPLPGVSVRLVGEDGRDAADGHAGQVLVKGSNVFAGYWRNPPATAAAFDGPWFRTGDIAERAADGYYTLRGRVSDLIISGGFNIYPQEIEDVLAQVRGVREVTVIGRPDDVRGEVPVAYVVADREFDAAEARVECSRMLASFKIPRTFVVVDTLPRNALGKVQKHLLPS